MSSQRRATVYLDNTIFKALKMKSAHTERSLSDLLNEAARFSLAEDALDLEAIEERKSRPERSFEDFVLELKKDGLL